MTDETSTQAAIFEFYKNLLEKQSKFLPSGELAGILFKAGQTVLEAQIAYGRALQSANVDMFLAWTNQTASEKPERPSVEIKRNEVLAA
jgi:hypothetical protein